LRPGCDPEAAIVRRGYAYFFFLEVFFATFLVAALAVFFAFFAFLAMSSSVKKSLNEYAHAVHRHAHY
jgi:predicted membrane protein